MSPNTITDEQEIPETEPAEAEEADQDPELPQPFNRQKLIVKKDPKHTIHYEEYGNPNGIPLLFLHGGPGIGSDAQDTRFFDLGKFHVVIFDQRYAPKSSFKALEEGENPTQDMLQDIDKLRRKLNWHKKPIHLFGGSWGSTLGLTYAIAHPESVASLTMWGVFLATPDELHDMYVPEAEHAAGHVSQQFPRAWQYLIDFIPDDERHAPLANHIGAKDHALYDAYYKRLLHPNPKIWHEAVRRLTLWSDVISCQNETEAFEEFASDPGPQNATEWHDERDAALLDYHFYRNMYYLPENHILGNLEKLRHTSIRILQGNQDYNCTTGGETLFRALQNTPRDAGTVLSFQRVDGAHGTDYPAVEAALMQAMREVAATSPEAVQTDQPPLTLVSAGEIEHTTLQNINPAQPAPSRVA